MGLYWHCSRNPPFWGYLIVGTFYDQHNNIVWSTEIFALQRDTRSDREEDTGQLISIPDSDSNTSQDLNDIFFRSLNFAQNNSTYQSAHVPTYEHQTHPHQLWDPSLAGPVPGNWITAFDHRLGNWKHTYTAPTMSNPVNGPDMEGRRPPWGPQNGVPLPRWGEPYIPHGGYGAPAAYGNYYYPAPTYQSYPVAPATAAAPYPGSTAYAWPGAQHQQGYYPPPPPGTYPFQPGGQSTYAARTAQGLPALDPRNPAATLSNSTGGTGCEPGYNYFFPAAHTKIHVFRTTTPPWQLPTNARIQFSAFHVPVNTTLAELLKGFGATNANPKKNKCFEIVQAGNGRWYKGLCFSGDDKEMMKKSLAEVGWDAGRNGVAGGKPVVCVWLVKD
ncbi:hypothetical protein CORC01_02652 [Colletotrichum orchidophilum]|uniref:Uncharacterized protein n=1 Tax=Colletotrichum orchidophilum TaxID=1209926 RepID=A0A1G4BLA9_9PEZI|nr:uncharacterized protein CORC01_02652 [Colletotrichum orchidophilum]OHF02073.1 hypothetical protein CORC01_02652 [Colletotrichum orchidophilum]